MTEIYDSILKSGILTHTRSSVGHYKTMLSQLQVETSNLEKGIEMMVNSLDNLNTLFGEVYDTVDPNFGHLSNFLFDIREKRLERSFDNIKEWSSKLSKSSAEYLQGLESVDTRIKSGMKINNNAIVRLEKFKSAQKKMNSMVARDQPITPRIHNKISQREFDLDHSVKEFLKVQQQLEEDSFDFFQIMDSFNKLNVVNFLSVLKDHYVGNSSILGKIPTPPYKSCRNQFQTALDFNGITNVNKVSKSLDIVLQDPVALPFFQDYCRKEYCAENLAFYQAVQVFKQSFKNKRTFFPPSRSSSSSSSSTTSLNSRQTKGSSRSNSKQNNRSPVHPSANNSPGARRKRFRNEDEDEALRTHNSRSESSASASTSASYNSKTLSRSGSFENVELERKDSSSSTPHQSFDLISRVGSNPTPYVRIVKQKSDTDDFLKSIASELNTREALKSAALNIYNQFIPNKAPEQINISADIFAILSLAVKKGQFSVSMFDAAQTAIYELMETDTWRRFTKDDLYQDMIKRLTRRTFNVASKFSMNKAVADVDSGKSHSSSGGHSIHSGHSGHSGHSSHSGHELKKKASQVRLSLGNSLNASFGKFTKPDTPNLNKTARYSLANQSKHKAPGSMPIPFSFGGSKSKQHSSSSHSNAEDDLGFGSASAISSESQLDAYFDSEDSGVSDFSDFSESENEEPTQVSYVSGGNQQQNKSGKSNAFDGFQVQNNGKALGNSESIANKTKHDHHSNRQNPHPSISKKISGMNMPHIPHLNLKADHSKPRSSRNSLSNSSRRNSSRRMSLSQMGAMIGNRLSLSSKRSNRI